MYLNEEEKELISKEIENLEENSSAELVAVVTKRSDNYKYEYLAINIFVTIFISIAIITIKQIDTLLLLQIQMFIFLSLYFLFNKYNDKFLYLIPKVYKRENAKEYAHKQFFNLGLNKTKTNQAIMFFVSLDEKYVEIITDETINSKIPNSFWQNIVDDFIKDVKQNKLSSGYLKAIKSCSHLLIKEFPIKSDDINELQNDVIELK